ncbi:GNAT family N-acetyltransferase [uncultured Gimesia sp.]|uniref:GNAT family N-acetyltransferase n=1 Tax=uncultured Gimesia sp. TaxID=1678688 RepID=UPI0030DB979A|tara:strand:- start:14986 stop:15462 length:477 start_codon:yes stop_codon:yes gene_type:complete
MKIFEADLTNPQHASAVVLLLNSYADSPEGAGKSLPEDVQHNLTGTLQKRPDAAVVLAFEKETPAGLVICIEGFSTFACKPLLNIHDVFVAPEYRGQGLARQLFDHVETIAKARGCCKLTLEVLEGNKRAQAAYTKFGFAGYELDPEMGQALFWEKKL